MGVIVTLPSPETAELLSRTGFDWLFVDGEHAPLSPLECQRILQGVADRCACIVRVSQAGEREIKSMLDTGADGVLVPQVNSAEQARQVVDWCRYPPLGTRGVGLARAHGYGLDFAEYVETANRNVVVVVQAEHWQAVENIEAIAAVEGVDAVLIGPYDLAASMGKMGEVTHPEVLAAIDRVTRACLEAGVKLGIFGVDADAVRPYVDRGYTLLVSGTDALYLAGGAASTLEALRRDSKEDSA